MAEKRVRRAVLGDERRVGLWIVPLLAITALIGGFIALIAAITRRAFTNEALLQRLDRELIAERTRIDAQRADDRKADAQRLDRIETDIRAMRDVMFEAFQRGRTD